MDYARRCSGCDAICTRSIVSQTDTMCCECHGAGSYCPPGAHETRRVGDRDIDDSRMIVAAGQRAPRCLDELTVSTCDLAERCIAHAHPEAD